ncbi:MAG: fused MFS/spermidine synthase, partial [Bdellovibrionales bacterium]|nr:fused MFS/spermidine synthase [Bdellovibrionales bacterium]
HFSLSAAKPQANQLTEYYLWISIGGAIGGMLNSFVAPLVFSLPFEYPLALVASLLVLGGPFRWPRSILLALILALALLYIEIYQFQTAIPFLAENSRLAIVLGIITIILFTLCQPRYLLGCVMFLVFFISSRVNLHKQGVLETRRNFFGVVQILHQSNPERIVMKHGDTAHGVELTSQRGRCRPDAYYFPDSPGPQLVSALQARGEASTVLLLGIGSAALTCYAGPGSIWELFEINPKVVEMAKNPKWFSFLRDSRAAELNIHVVDARIGVEQQRDHQADLLILDTFSSDSIPVHLVTREAIALYRSKLKSGGMILFHISNRFLNLVPPLTALAYEMKYRPFYQNTGNSVTKDLESFRMPAEYVAFVPEEHLEAFQLMRELGWQPLPPNANPAWTDQFSNIFDTVRWGN